MKNTTLRVGLRGTVTLPKQLREQYALTTNDLLLAESTAEGILLRPAVATPIEIYTDERIAEFREDERKLEERQRQRDASTAALGGNFSLPRKAASAGSKRKAAEA